MAEVRNFLVLSTGHVSGETAKFLDSTAPREWPVLGGPYGEYGWFFYCDEADHDYPEAMPSDLKAVLRYARATGYVHVLLDCDADKLNLLPIYDW